MPIAGADDTMPTANERHLTKYCRITKLEELKIIMCPNPDSRPYVMYIIHSLGENEARENPIIPETEPSTAVNL